jgi:hypothetical protein
LLFLFQLVLEAVRARQLQDTLLMDKRTMEREVQQANASLCFYDMRAARVEDQVFLSLIFEFELIAMGNVNILSQLYFLLCS